MSRGGVVVIATGYGLYDEGVRVRVPVRASSFLYAVQTDSGTHQASYSIGIGGSFPGGKVTGA
jgi:hypothetical protein